MGRIIDCEMHIGDEVFVHGYIDEIRNDTIIIRNVGGYFGTSRDEVFYYEEDEPQTSGVVWTEDAIKNEPKSYSTWASTDELQTERENESMTTKEAMYLLRNTAWIALSLAPIDEAIEMACDALAKVEYINSQLGKPKYELKTYNGIGCLRCKERFDCYDRDMPNAALCNNYGKITDEPQTEREGE